MLSWKAIIFLFFIFFTGQILCMAMEGSWFTGYELTIAGNATAFDVPTYGGLWGTLRTGVGLFTVAIPRALSWNYSFLSGSGYDLVKWILLYPLSAGFVYGIACVFITTITSLWAR